MKDIVKQFKESISKLTTEEFKKVWDEIEAEIGTDYPIFNAKTKCFEYKINNTETIEDSALDYVNSTSITFPEDAVKKAFKSGVEFAQRWISVDDELPPCSDEDILIKGIDFEGRKDIPDIGYMHSSSNNIPNKENFISLSGEIMEVTHWRPIELK